MNQDTTTLNQDILMHMIRGRYFDYSTLEKIAKLSPELEKNIEIHYPMVAHILKTDFFKHYTLDIEQVMSLITTNPARRVGQQRLTDEQQRKFVELVSKNEEDRTVKDLYDAGIIRPDYELENIFKDISTDLHYIRTDGFLKAWLETGYINESTLRNISLLKMPEVGYYHTHIVSKIQNMHLINMSYAIIDDRRCDVRGFFLPHASLDNVDFYKAMFNDATLGGATMYNSSVDDCNGYRDYNYHVASELIGCGVIGLSLDDYDIDDY